MKKLSLLGLLTLFGCNQQNTPTPDPNNNQPHQNFEKTPEIAKELKAQPTIDDQFALLYRKFDYTLDRSDSLTGRDENKDGIRDDIEAFINALEVSEPVRDALKQNARYSQKNLYYDWSEKTEANIYKAMKIGFEYEKVIACKDFVGIPVDDSIDTSKTIRALTYNTKARTIAYLAYNHLQDGSVSTSLPAEEQYCE
ncbi:chromosome partitioning protein ParA [Vibrio parahaemolyticus]|uniref:chromosome partitioning protein ParA n=1 Tax=Vibrio parahaemolyticus TaxID=670 RepID=UPI00111E5FCE|nr:chromosome partitioning protein ParA [Vibrio parahaemolyticus]EIA1553608.1 chromosome partitioning protein ParA [Vibrio parahaemolyticus]TOB89758.1 chromosome partitioning protein ParA [Vibrio parahaemolyticus]